MQLLLLIIGAFLIHSPSFANPAIKSIRVDPSYFYSLYPNETPTQIAKKVVTQAKSAQVNTLFLYAYNSYYGAFYPSNYTMTRTEGGLGVSNIFGVVLSEAKAAGLNVIAVMPLNDFRHVWSNKPDWRVKKKNGTDYKPYSTVFLLSAWHPQFRLWLDGFYADFLKKFPTVDGIEAVEPMVDFFWDKSSDYNAASNTEFKKRFPKGTLGDSNWLKFRAQGLTELLGLMAKKTHAANKFSAVVQTWSVAKDGSLYSTASLRDGMGFDFDGILNLSGDAKMDIISGEFMWQQWRSEYGSAVFNPAWTRSAALAFLKYINNRSFPIVHVEISPFSGSAGTVTPTVTDLSDTLNSVKDIAPGIDIYDYNQLTNMNAWSALEAWNTP